MSDVSIVGLGAMGSTLARSAARWTSRNRLEGDPYESGAAGPRRVVVRLWGLLGALHGARICEIEGMRVDEFGSMLAELLPVVGGEVRQLNERIQADRYDGSQAALAYGFWVDSVPRHCPACRRDLRTLRAVRQEYDQQLMRVLEYGDLESKKRLAAVIDQLYEFGGELPPRINENRRRLANQIARTES